MKIKFKKITTILLFSVIMLSTFTFFSQVLAQETNAEYVPLSPLPDGNGGTMKSTNLTSYLISMFKLLIGVAGALAVVMIVIGGIQYMSTDAIYGKSEGKERIRNALGGLLLALASWLILNTINPKLLEIKVDIPQAKSTLEKPKEVPGGASENTTAPSAPRDSDKEIKKTQAGIDGFGPK